MANYEKLWSSANPGFLIIMLDQSGSMGEEYIDGESKASFASKGINNVIGAIIDKNYSGDKPKDRCFIAVIGYATEAKLLKHGFLSEFAAQPLRLEKIKKKMNDGAGGFIEVEDNMPIWFEQEANGVTNMAAAFKIAAQLINDYFKANSASPAPIIINISDGAPCIWNGTEAVLDLDETTKMAQSIMATSCEDGNVLIFNAHIEASSFNVQLPNDRNMLPNDDGAHFLFDISSVIPDSYKKAADKSGLKVKDGSRGCMISCDAEGLVKLIDFGSSKGLSDIKK